MLVNIGISEGGGIQTQLAPAIGEGICSLPITVSRGPRHCCQGCGSRGKNSEFASIVHFGISPLNSHQKAIKAAITGIIDATLPQTLPHMTQHPFWEVPTPKIEIFQH